MELKATTYVTSMKLALSTLQATIAQLPKSGGVEDGIRPDGVVPAEIVRFLAQLRLLQGVPVRVFYRDRNATDALVQGALSVGAVNAADRAQLAQLYATVRDEVD